MINKTLCVDANNMLKVAFHGDQTTYTKNFGYMGAVKTFFMIIRKVIKEQQINKVILFWDDERSGKLRWDIYPDYKSDRRKNWEGSGIILSEKDVYREENADKSLMKQRERVKNYAEELFFRQVQDPFVEADDCIAYYILNCMQPDEEVIILSEDGDFTILIDDKVSLYKNSLKSLIKKKSYFLFHKHHQENAALIKAIVGCDTDKIAGVAGVGETTLLKYFPEIKTQKVTFEHIYNRAKEINEGRKKPLVALTNIIEGWTTSEKENASKALLEGKEYVRTKILNGKHLFELNYKLVNLKEPFINEEAIETVISYCTHPISDKERGGKNLLRLMYEDEFIHLIPGGADKYKEFIEVFLPIVKKEKEIYLSYLATL